MEQLYDKKRALLARSEEPGSELSEFWGRICSPPFKSKSEPARVWLQLWPLLDQAGQRTLAELPDPCLNHLEERMRNKTRARKLLPGTSRVVKHDQELFLEGLRLYPHALCRACEVVGSLPDSAWSELERDVQQHRLWMVRPSHTAEEFWATAELLSPHRDLPQRVLDCLDSGRPRESADWEEFEASLRRFLVREKLERLRFETYAVLRQAAVNQ